MSYAAHVIPGEGTALKVAIATVMTVISEQVEIDGPDSKVDEVEKTGLTDTAKRYRPCLVPEAGTLTMKIWYDPNEVVTHSILSSRITAPGPVDSWEMDFNDGRATTPSKATFMGFLTGFKLTGEKVGENIAAEIGIRIDGGITYAPGTG